MKNTILYFGYGMNTNLTGMAGRCPGAVSLGHAVLPNHEFRFAVHADVLENKEMNVDGVLWEINRKHLRSLDMLEGYPFYYDRKVVEVIHNGAIKRALVYYMQPGNLDNMPAQSYLDMLCEGYEENKVPLTQLKSAIKFINNYYYQLERKYDYQY